MVKQATIIFFQRLANLECILTLNVYLTDNNCKDMTSREEVKQQNKRKKKLDIKDNIPKVYTCNVCDKSFKSNFKLLRHSYIHLDVKPFPCEICGRRFSRKDHRNVHYKLHYTSDRKCICKICGQLFHSEANVAKHVERVHNASDLHDDIVCYDCGETFYYEAQMKRHYNLYHRLRYYCEICGNESLSEDSYRKHIRRHVLCMPYTCFMCHGSFMSIDEMRQHFCEAEKSAPVSDIVVKIIVRDSLEFEEDIPSSDQLLAVKLEKKFDNRGRKPKSQKELEMKAELSSIDFMGETLLADTQEKDTTYQTEESYFEIDEALENSSSIYDYDSMIRDAGEKNTEEEDEDFIPGLKFSKDSKRKNLGANAKHMRLKRVKISSPNKAKKHTNVKFICQYCDREFGEEAVKLAHEAVHTDKYSNKNGKSKYMLSCKFCPMKFVDQSKLARHLRKHTGERPFICQVCSKSFYRADHLNRHVKTHTTEGDEDVELEDWNQCPICEEEFQTINELDVHILTHNVDKEDEVRIDYEIHLCSFCDETFDDMGQLQSHVEMQHPNCTQLYTCDYCPGSFTHMSAQLDHQNYCNNNPTPNSSNFTNGIDDKSAEDTNTFIFNTSCDGSDKKFESETPLQSHKIEMHSSNEFCCKACDLIFLDQSELDLHINSVHAAETSSPSKKKSLRFSARKYACVRQAKSSHQCKYCSSTFSSIHDFLIHMRSHSSDHTANTCFVCEKECSTEESLTEHMAVHNDVVVEFGIPKNMDTEELL